MTRFHDITRAQVTLQWRGRTLLGDVTRCFVREFPFPCTMADVRHFNGEPWPVNPVMATALAVLDRRPA